MKLLISTIVELGRCLYPKESIKQLSCSSNCLILTHFTQTYGNMALIRSSVEERCKIRKLKT